MKAENGLKKCSKCGEVKAVEEFSRCKKYSDELNCRCKNCDKEYSDARKDARRDYFKEYRNKNREKLAESSKSYRTINKEKIYNRNTEYRACNFDRISKYQRKYSNINKERICSQRKNYRYINRDRLKGTYISLVESLSDRYVKQIIRTCTRLAPPLIPPELIEIKRTILKTKRLCKTLKN